MIIAGMEDMKKNWQDRRLGAAVLWSVKKELLIGCYSRPRAQRALPTGSGFIVLACALSAMGTVPVVGLAWPIKPGRKPTSPR